MGYGLKRLLEIKAEREKKRAERERIKAEKAKIKVEEKKKAKSKKLKQKRNARAYAKRKKASDAFHKSMGDEKGVFSIYLMKDGRRIKFFCFRRFKVAALQIYHDLIAKNQEGIKFPQKYTKCSKKLKEHKYEIVLVKKINEDEDSVALLRNEDGKFIENYLVDAPTHKIIAKNDWIIDETFYVYGFDPQKERKNLDYIYNNIILYNLNTCSRIIVYNNKLLCFHDDDLDIIICKTIDQSIELYDTIEKMIDSKKYPMIHFMGRVEGSSSDWVVEEMMKKTGWNERACRRNRGWLENNKMSPTN